MVATIPAPRFAIVVTVLSGAIATVLAVVASVFTEHHPMYFDGAKQLLLSWSGRELGQGLACLAAVVFFGMRECSVSRPRIVHALSRFHKRGTHD